MSQVKNAYKDTLNLPNTTFPMKANLNQNEPLRLKKWQTSGLYHQLLSDTKNSPPFIFHDGPPYANGDIHIGHLLNKVLKDLVVRSQLLLGNRCEFIPGWDCHGLPIEHKVLSELTPEKKQKLASLSPDQERLAIRNECKKYAEKFIKIQSSQMQRLLTLADYNAPYLTFQPKYESSVLSVFAGMVKEGIVFRQLKPVHWSIANQTALAEAELEYMDKTSHSAAVKFNIPTHSFDISGPLHALIWTTTPWTLPANLAIAYGDAIAYVIATIDGAQCIVADDRLSYIKQYANVTQTTPISTADLSGLVAEHPFINRPSPLLPAKFVTTDDGTGLVHIAPGHGNDDYLLGQSHGLDTYCPVLSDGTFDTSVPDWLQGQLIWNANQPIIDHLRNSNHLCFDDTFVHSYPHDWRSKTPVIFRSTDQWFIGVDLPLNSTKKSLREMALSSIDNDIEFFPNWGKARLRGMLDARPDWCISRQRAWGLPIPAFQDANGTILLTDISVRHVAKMIEQDGSDAWFRTSAADLLSGYDLQNDTMAPQTFDIQSAQKLYDIFDVWFESGSSWEAVLNERQSTTVADLYLEGTDQHRGWFHLSLLPSLAIQHRAPYKALLTHGFIVDKDGRKMSKSTGNALTVDAILSNYGAEVTRWWVSSLSYENDIKVDLSFFKDAGDHYRKIRNTIRFLLSNLFDFSMSITDCIDAAHAFDPHTVDAYVLALATEFEASVLNHYRSYQFRDANSAIYNFCNDTLSSFYLSAIKDRLYCDEPASDRRQRAQITLRILFDILIRLLSPILPHTCDEAMEALSNNESSIQGTVSFKASFSNSANWAAVIQARKEILKRLEDAKTNGIENSLDAGVELPANLELAQFHPDLSDVFGVSRVSISDTPTILIHDLQHEPRCERSWKRDDTVKTWPNGAILSERDYHAITQTH